MKHIYNTGKVKIGLAYEPPTRVELSLDEERLQTALLRNRAGRQANLFIVSITIAAVAAIAILAGATA